MTEYPIPSDEAIMRSLNANPQIKSRIAALLAVVEDAVGDLKEADAAEMRLIKSTIRRIRPKDTRDDWQAPCLVKHSSVAASS